MQAHTLDIERLSIQNLINAYCMETGRFKILLPNEQDRLCHECCKGKSALFLSLEPLGVQLIIPLLFSSILGQHQISDKLYIKKENKLIEINALMLANLLLQDILHLYPEQDKINIRDVLSRWIDNSEKIKTIFSIRKQDIDEIFEGKKLNFIDTEQALFCGHAMHPAPKTRIGFDEAQWKRFSPETNGCFQLHYWLVEPSLYVEKAENHSILEKIRQGVLDGMTAEEKNALSDYEHFKLVILHPWQAQYLKNQDFYERLLSEKRLIDLGQIGMDYHATTSVRTVANLDCDWMFKLSLSVAITNSVRINLPKEGYRGLLANKVWNSEVGKNIKDSYPMFGVVNDPAWVGLIIDGQIINETICIVRNNPFSRNNHIINLATLCQDHPFQKHNLLHFFIKNIHEQQEQNNVNLTEIAHQWFEDFLKVSLVPMVGLYHDNGMVFEAHQQNCLIEIVNNLPYKFWVRDNQSFGYVVDYANELVEKYPELDTWAECVVPIDFANSRFVYYFIGNTIFSLISAIAKTGFSTEQELLNILRTYLERLLNDYPDSKLLNTLLFDDTLFYKGNLLTRLHDLDELVAPVETQSIYIQIKNPIKI